MVHCTHGAGTGGRRHQGGRWYRTRFARQVQDFAANLAASQAAEAVLRDRRFLARHFTVPLANILTAPREWDKQGIDYLCLLRDGTVVACDAQGRQTPCRRYWHHKQRPEVAFELLMSSDRNLPGKFGRDVPPLAHYLLQTYQPDDYSGAVLVSTSAAWSGIQQGRFSDLTPIAPGATRLSGGRHVGGA